MSSTFRWKLKGTGDTSNNLSYYLNYWSDTSYCPTGCVFKLSDNYVENNSIVSTNNWEKVSSSETLTPYTGYWVQFLYSNSGIDSCPYFIPPEPEPEP